MTGMEQAIEQVARAIYGAMHRDTDQVADWTVQAGTVRWETP